MKKPKKKKGFNLSGQPRKKYTPTTVLTTEQEQVVREIVDSLGSEPIASKPLLKYIKDQCAELGMAKPGSHVISRALAAMGFSRKPVSCYYRQ